MRPQLKKLLKDKDCLTYLNCTSNNLAVMKSRGYLSKRYADGVEWRSEGKYKARLLIKSPDPKYIHNQPHIYKTQ